MACSPCSTSSSNSRRASASSGFRSTTPTSASARQAGVARIPLRDPALARGPRGLGNPQGRGRAALSSPVCGNGPGPRATGGQARHHTTHRGRHQGYLGPPAAFRQARREGPYRVIEQPAIARDGIFRLRAESVNCQWNSPTGGSDLLAQGTTSAPRCSNRRRTAQPASDGGGDEKHLGFRRRGRERGEPPRLTRLRRARRQPRRSRRNPSIGKASSLDHLPETRVVARSSIYRTVLSGSANSPTTSTRWCKSRHASIREASLTLCSPPRPNMDASVCSRWQHVRSILTCCSTTSLRSTSPISGAAPANAFTRLRTASAARNRARSQHPGSRTPRRAARAGRGPTHLEASGLRRREGSRLCGHVPCIQQVAGRTAYFREGEQA